jgi:hypothetical protein
MLHVVDDDRFPLREGSPQRPGSPPARSASRS